MKCFFASYGPLCFMAALLLGIASSDAAEGDVFFRERVEPILRKRCSECHSHGGTINGGLALDSRSGWQMGRRSCRGLWRRVG